MTQEEEYSQYRERLLTLINSINREIPIEESNQVLIVYKLNTPEKIRKFCKNSKVSSPRGQAQNDRGRDSKGGSASEQRKSAITSVK